MNQSDETDAFHILGVCIDIVLNGVKMVDFLKIADPIISVIKISYHWLNGNCRISCFECSVVVGCGSEVGLELVTYRFSTHDVTQIYDLYICIYIYIYIYIYYIPVCVRVCMRVCEREYSI